VVFSIPEAGNSFVESIPNNEFIDFSDIVPETDFQ
jgi:hypothetical protein